MRGAGLRRNAGLAIGLLASVALRATPAAADAVYCRLEAAADTTSVQVSLLMQPSFSGSYVPCPEESVLTRTDESGETTSLPVRWSTGCPSSGHCCGHFVDDCTPPGRLHYRLATPCGNAWMPPPNYSVDVERGPETCPASEGGCGCAVAGSSHRLLELVVLGSFLVLGLWALRRDRG